MYGSLTIEVRCIMSIGIHIGIQINEDDTNDDR